MTEPDGDEVGHGAAEDFKSHDSTSRPSKRFRFKDKHQRSSNLRNTSRSRSRSPASRSSYDSQRHRHRRHRHHHGRHHSRKTSPPPSPVPDPETAFRLSLFDALADDEGAAFWEGVYGQPIHKYPNTKVGPEGELEQMTEEEYATYVRRKMWEKSLEGIEEERQAKARAKQENEKRNTEQVRAEKQARRKDREVFDVDVEESLRRGEERKEDKKWKHKWESYLKKWSDLNALLEQGEHPSTNSEPPKLAWPWPTASSRSSELGAESVETFFRKCTAVSSSEHPSLALMTALKIERIRWHPDKVQQRYGNLGMVDEEVLRGVTAVFQIVDRLWNEEKERK